MKQKLLQLPSGQWYTLTNRTDRDKITKTLNELISEGSKFVIDANGDCFQRLCCDFFEQVGKDGYEVRKSGTGEIMTFNGKVVAVR